ncbi:hypothetical protein EHO59_07540 [Leptospira semungkisensis]|uniref:Lipoprotein n=1 Tax=Leptospira semungkisensis TaxID=2484985 RepID=A0A4R9GAI8_9LEPT|nr:hypothetical protein [Leptospira semungkisensis]TGK07937.1 hypothetical protein EHO59_07540 [Leptospira semungkisensis]
MHRVLTVLFLLILFAQCEQADPEFRRKAWENVSESGFISHDYFQVVVTVPIPDQERPLLELREECKARAVRKRDEVSVTLILAQLTEERKNLIGIARTSSVPKYETPILPNTVLAAQASRGSGASIATQTLIPTEKPSEEQEEKKEKKKTEIVSADYLAYRASLAWFIDKLFLFKEDYSDPKTCTMVFRVVDADLMKRILESPITPKM